MLDLLPVQAMDLVDTTLVWLLIWAGIVWLRSNPARLALAGLAMLGVVYLVARQLGLVMMTWILQGFFAVSVLVAVVVFQQELRRLFEQIASFSPLRGRRDATGMDSIDTLVLSLAKLAEQYRGALIVIPGQEPLDRHLDGGVLLDARLSEPLLLSLFDPNSPGHDGAVVLNGDRAERFAVHLPLSTDHAQLGHRGTRHAAALGLSERTDALCIVVSEERGTVSVAHQGHVETMVAAQHAGERVRRFISELSPEAGAPGRKAALRMVGHWREALLALPLAAGLWFLVVPGASEVVAERDVPVKVTGLPSGLEVEGLDPATVRVRLGGRRLDLFLLDPSKLYVRVDAILVDLGRRTFRLSEENVMRPEGLSVLGVEPDSVKLDLRRIANARRPRRRASRTTGVTIDGAAAGASPSTLIDGALSARGRRLRSVVRCQRVVVDSDRWRAVSAWSSKPIHGALSEGVHRSPLTPRCWSIVVEADPRRV